MELFFALELIAPDKKTKTPAAGVAEVLTFKPPEKLFVAPRTETVKFVELPPASVIAGHATALLVML
jgi:hypothetical protein